MFRVRKGSGRSLRERAQWVLRGGGTRREVKGKEMVDGGRGLGVYGDEADSSPMPERGEKLEK